MQTVWLLCRNFFFLPTISVCCACVCVRTLTCVRVNVCVGVLYMCAHACVLGMMCMHKLCVCVCVIQVMQMLHGIVVGCLDCEED